MKKFFRSESGAVTVDWVVMTAAAMGLGLASVGAVRTGTGALGESILAALSGVTNAAFTTMGFEDGSFLGWSTNQTGYSEALGRFLGPFGGDDNTVTHDVTVPEGATEVTISFDLLMLDSWDGADPSYSDGRGDGIAFSIDGTEIGFSALTNSDGTAMGARNGTFDMNGTRYAYELTQVSSGDYYRRQDDGWQYTDTVWNVTVTADSPPAGGFQFGVTGTSNESMENESYGIDNYVVSSN